MLHQQNDSSEFAKLSIGELVASQPKCAAVLESYGIDYCCGGKRSLAEACAEKGIALSVLEERLANLHQEGCPESEPNWNQVSLEQLITHIIKTYHLPLCEQLPRIEKLCQKVAAAHAERHPEMVQLAALFRNFKADLMLHMQKEEIMLFPAIVASESQQKQISFGCGGGIENPIKVMLQEHDSAGEALKSMRALTNNYTPPADACNTFRVLVDALHQLETDMHHHVHKENNILFPRALRLAKADCKHR